MKKILIGIFIALLSLPVQAFNVSGVIIDSENDNDNLVGVSVIEKGTTNGTSTSTDGGFSIDVANNSAILRFTYVGHNPYECIASACPHTITMSPNSTTLEETVVTACNKIEEGIKSGIAAKDGTCYPRPKEDDDNPNYNPCIGPRYVLSDAKIISFDTNNEARTQEIERHYPNKFIDEENDIVTYYECIDTNGQDCDPMPQNATVAKMENGNCVIKKCDEPQYKLENNTCVDQVGTDCTSKIRHAKTAKYEMADGKLVCRVTTCDEPGWVASEDRTKCEASDGPCPDNLLKQLEHATKGQMRKGQCVATECAADYEVKNGKCVLLSGGCKPTQENAKSGKYETRNGELVCVITKCAKGYLPNDDGTQCEISEGPCTDAQIAAVPKAIAGEMKRKECFITECDKGWHVSKNKKKCEQAELSEADSKQKVADLKDNAQKMKDKEQSTANKLLGGAAIGATGIGAMNLASGLAEQKADSAAEEDMKAYLATFVCDYGRGRNIKGGETNIDLPGGNDLFAAVNEYRALAADLKIRKEALGKQPGIESEVIIDAADTGLYDNVGLGRQSGAYTSLSRALTDETSKDAEEWAKQKADTASKVKTGAITAAAGAIGGMIGNLAINSGEKNKNKVDEINKKYEGLKQPLLKLEQEVKNIPPSPEPTKCPSNATGTYPTCKCTGNAVYSSENICVACGNNEEPNAAGNQCVCRQGYSGTPCVEIPKAVTPKCNINEENRKNVDIDKNGNCTCFNTFPDVPTCACNPDTHVWQNNTCTEKITQEKLTITLPAASLFNTGKSDLKSEAQTALKDFITSFNAWFAQNPNAPHCIKITGHTDKTGGPKINQPLSERRAKAVKEYLSTNEIATKQLKSEGVGATDCVPDGNTPECRKVTIMVDKLNCDGSGAVSAVAPIVPTEQPLITGTTLSSASDGNDSEAENPAMLKELAKQCNSYENNGVSGYFVINPNKDYQYMGGLNRNVKHAYCLFYKREPGQTASDTNIGGSHTYNGPSFSIPNARFVTINNASTMCKFNMNDFDTYANGVSFTQAAMQNNNQIGCEYTYYLKSDTKNQNRIDDLSTISSVPTKLVKYVSEQYGHNISNNNANNISNIQNLAQQKYHDITIDIHSYSPPGRGTLGITYEIFFDDLDLPNDNWSANTQQHKTKREMAGKRCKEIQEELSLTQDISSDPAQRQAGSSTTNFGCRYKALWDE